MGKLIVEQIVSADGYAEDAEGRIDFFEEERSRNDADADQLRLLESVGAIVLGRRTYELFAGFWPEMDPAQEPVARPINALPKYVVSNTLAAAPWGRHDAVQVLRGDGAAAVADLKRRTEGDLIVWGSLSLADELLRKGVVDVLRLRLVPKLIGAGRPVTPRDLGHRQLALRSLRAYPDGFVVIEYGCA